MFKQISLDGKLSQKERLLKIYEFLCSHIELERILFVNNSDEDIAKLFSNAGFALWNSEQYFGSEAVSDEKDREFLSVFINFGMYHVLRRWQMTDTQKTPSEIAALISRIILK